MPPAVLAAGVAAADGDLAAHHRRAAAHLDPGADRIAVGARLLQLDLDPVAGVRCWCCARACAFSQRLTTTRSSRPSRLKSVSAAPRELAKLAMPALSPTSWNLPSAALQQQIVGVLGGEVRHLGDIALGDEQVDQAVIVHVLELGVPGGARPDVAAGVGALRGDALGEGDVLVVRLRRAVLRDARQGLQLVVGHAGQEIVGIAVAGEVVAGDAHAPDAQRLPAVLVGVERRRLAGLDAPELLLAAPVVFAVVGDAQARRARAVPVGEQHRQRAVARLERQRRVELRCGLAVDDLGPIAASCRCTSPRDRCPACDRCSCRSRASASPRHAPRSRRRPSTRRRRRRSPRLSLARSNLQAPRPRITTFSPTRSSTRSVMPSLSMSSG